MAGEAWRWAMPLPSAVSVFFLFLWSADRGARPDSTTSVGVPRQRINMAAAEVGALPPAALAANGRPAGQMHNVTA